MIANPTNVVRIGNPSYTSYRAQCCHFARISARCGSTELAAALPFNEFMRPLVGLPEASDAPESQCYFGWGRAAGRSKSICRKMGRWR